MNKLNRYALFGLFLFSLGMVMTVTVQERGWVAPFNVRLMVSLVCTLFVLALYIFEDSSESKYIVD